MLQLRNAIDFGGFYWSTNLILSQASVVTCAVLYHFYYEEDIAEADLDAIYQSKTSTNSTGTKLTEEQLQASVGSLLTIFVVSFTLFMVKIDRKYVKTFYSPETGHLKAKRYFLQGKDEFVKSQIFKRNKYQWMTIRGKVAEWLEENWDKWERDKPEWFSTLFISRIDDDIMPARVLERLKQEAEGGVRRRSSFMERVSLREIEERGGGEEDAPAHNDDDSESEDEDGGSESEGKL